MSRSIFDRFQIIQGFESNSASRTDIWEALDTSTGQRVIFKVFVHKFQMVDPQRGKQTEETSTITNALVHEINVYKALRKRLVEDPYVNCRNILCILGDGQFSTEDLIRGLEAHTSLSAPNIRFNVVRNALFLLHLAEKPRHSITRSISKAKVPSASELQVVLEEGNIVRFDAPMTYGFFITPKIDQLTIEDGIDKREVNLEMCMRYIFVIFTTLLLMSSVGINQNDLHWSNILLSRSYVGPSPYHKRHYFLVYNNELILIDNPFIPIVYDFDRTSVRGTRVASLEDQKETYVRGGNCPVYHSKRDFVKTLCCLYKYCTDLKKYNPKATQIQEEIMQLISSSNVRDAILRSHEACWMSTEDDSNSLLCFTQEMNQGVASQKSILAWSRAHAYYLSCTLDELDEASRLKERSPAFPRVQQMLHIYRRDIPDRGADLETIVRANIQIVEHKSRNKLYATLTKQILSLLR